MANPSNKYQQQYDSLLANIDIEDVDYIEKDLAPYELVSLGFLLFGGTRGHAEYVLQKLMIMFNSNVAADTGKWGRTDLLRQYATINPCNWRASLVEALAIINAKRVLRKLGLQWEMLRQHYLPHIAELSLHVQPLLKALYKMCERLTPQQAESLVMEVNGETHSLHFNDPAYLEVYLLDWLTRRIISVGEANATGANVQVLIDYLKLNDLHQLKMLLLSTISSNVEESAGGTNKGAKQQGSIPLPTQSSLASISSSEGGANLLSTVRESDLQERYQLRREQAGNILIINQQTFHREQNATLATLMPKGHLKPRGGTDVDKNRLINVFQKYGYKPIEFNNLTHTDLLFRLRETVKRSYLFDSIIVCILSHGIDGAVYGSNSIPVEIAEIEEIITAKELAGKPKMLIIQACQESTENIELKSEKRHAQRARVRDQSLSHLTDMIKAMSTVPRFASMRHPKYGTWFVQSLCDAVDNYGDCKHMLDILTAVQRDVANRRGDRNETMVPQCSYTLTKEFYLPRR